MKEMVLPLHLPYAGGSATSGPADLILPSAFASSPLPQLPPGAFMAPPDYDTATKSGVAGAPPDYEAACRAAIIEKDQETQPLTQQSTSSPPSPTPQPHNVTQQTAISVDAVVVTHHPQDQSSTVPPPRMV